jgi:hypothetical protein
LATLSVFKITAVQIVIGVQAVGLVLVHLALEAEQSSPEGEELGLTTRKLPIP